MSPALICWPPSSVSPVAQRPATSDIGAESQSTWSRASGRVMWPPDRWARKRRSVRTIFRVSAIRLTVVSFAASTTTRRCSSTSSSLSPALCCISQDTRSAPGSTRLRSIIRRSVATTYSLLAMAVSVPFIRSRAASTSRGPYSSGIPTSCVMTSIGRCSANWDTMSAWPVGPKSWISWSAKRVT